MELPKSFQFTITKNHVNYEHRCDSTRCVIAQACLEAMPEGYDAIPVVGSTMLFFKHADDRDSTDHLLLDDTARAIIRLFDNFSDQYKQALLDLIGDGVAFVVDTEAMTVTRKED